MSNGIDFHPPESPWFWVLVAIAIFLILLATGHVATAVVFLFLGIAIICLVANTTASEPSSVVWWICAICFVLALILGITLVPSEWSTPKTQEAITGIPIILSHMV
jgi:hypothetical protein